MHEPNMNQLFACSRLIKRMRSCNTLFVIDEILATSLGVRACELTLPRRVLIVLDEPRQAEIGDLAHQTVSDQDVGGTQVPVDVVHPLDVRHPCRHLEHVKRC